MPQFRNSRHRFSPKYDAPTRSGETFSFLGSRRTSGEAIGSLSDHYLKAGESLDSLAHKAYLDSDKWYILADANPEKFFPLDMEAGEQISIPSAAYAALA